ncbi:Holliday junction branch migration protein RuvA [Desulfonatronovibrio hydrogenovorans]|uniref:Holliday junction branch migration protein RuvA n=1 Tax=Desulfonatronovibrio hydrogenovorans TaxID=53245 RepID=UPI00048D4FFD|nr:Holliday junction branch migration protein RuvA [Desulfonatronovibrio hydrogenovorans]
MIAFIQGTVLSLAEKSCILLTASGLGYEVHVSARDLQELPGIGQDAQLYISTVVREDALDLYGFFSLEERETFNVLLNTPKLGPKTALAILGIFSPEKLQNIVSSEDERMLSQVPGIGTKSARRILIDLKDRLKSVAPGKPGPASSRKKPSVREDVLAGLVSLGYAPVEVAHILDSLLENEPDLDVSSAIRAVLKEKAKEKL